MAEKPDRLLAYWRAAVGRKVSIRFRLHDDPDAGYSEAIGVVQSVRGDQGKEVEVSILTRTRGLVTVSASDITNAKVIAQ